MKNFFFILFFLSLQINAQKNDNNLKIIVHDANNFIQDESKLWIMNNTRSKLDDVPKLTFLAKKVDTTDYKKDGKGYKFYKTRLYFGLRNSDKIYEIPMDFYANKSNKFRENPIAFHNERFYIATYSLTDETHIEYSIYRLDEKENLKSEKISDRYFFGLYPIFHIAKDALYFRYYDNNTDVEDVVREFSVDEKFDKDKIAIGETKLKENLDVIKRLYDDEIKSVHDYSYKQYREMPNTVIDRKKYDLKTEANNNSKKKIEIVSLPIANLKNSDIEKWVEINDKYNRNSTTLFFQLKKFPEETKSGLAETYVKTKIRFGFKVDKEYYELPESFYIYDDNEEGFTNRPCLLFTDNKFYIYVPDFEKRGSLKGKLFTYTIGKGLTEEILFENYGWWWLPYFARDPYGDFALLHNSPKVYYNFKTSKQNEKWITKSNEAQIFNNALFDTKEDNDISKERWDYQIQDYRYAVHPLFLVNKIEPYKQSVFINDKKWSVLWNNAVFTNSEIDKNRLNQLNNLMTYDEGLSKAMAAMGNLAVAGHYYQLSPNSKFARENNIALHYKKKKNIIIYEDIPHTLIEVPYMPETKDQNPLITCESYANGAMLMQAINSDYQLTNLRKIKPDALKKDTDLSYFGLQQIIRGNKDAGEKLQNEFWKENKYWREKIDNANRDKIHEFDFGYKNNIIRTYDYNSALLLDNSIPFDNIPGNIIKYYEPQFLYASDSNNYVPMETLFSGYLKKLYDDNVGKAKTEKFYVEETEKFHQMTGIPKTFINLKKALLQPTLYAFQYQLFFGETKDYLRLDINQFRFAVFPKDLYNPSMDEIKTKIIAVLEMGKPIMIGIQTNEDVEARHAILIDGYKKVKDPNTGKILDVFKIKNSWGEKWDFEMNDGWIMANDIIFGLQNRAEKSINDLKGTFIPIIDKDGKAKFKFEEKPSKTYNYSCEYINDLNVLDKDFVEYSQDYISVYGKKKDNAINDFTKIGVTDGEGMKQFDAKPLAEALYNSKISKSDVVEVYKKYLGNLGYTPTFEEELSENATILYYKNFYIGFQHKGKCTITASFNFKSEKEIKELMKRMDFSKIKGEFRYSHSPSNGTYELIYLFGGNCK